MSWRIAIGTLLVAWTGCGGGPAPRTEYEQRLDKSGAAAMPEGASLKSFKRRAVRGELREGFIVMLAADECYAVGAAGERTIQAVALTVAAPTGAWLARTAGPQAEPMLKVCAKVSGPHRIEATITGRGEYAVAVFGPRPPGSSSSSASVAPPSLSARASASASATSPLVTPAATCSDVGKAEPFSRAVHGQHRACQSDADCISLKLDCSHLTCSGVNKRERASYAAPLDCRGYTGVLGNYDCDPQFGIEAPRCAAGCCVSVRVDGR